MIEEWRDVLSKPGVQASSLGRVRRQPRRAAMPHGGERIYFAAPTYGVVVRSKKGAAHSYRARYYDGIGNVKIHQAVCEAFHGSKPFPKAVVIHLDEDAHNNRPENLRWGTQKENLNASGFVAYCKGRTGEDSPVIKGQARKGALTDE